MRFWGNADVELCQNGFARTAEGQKHLFNLAHKLLKRPKSLPISVVIRIYEEMVSRADRFGECVALLAMLLLGLRTSEAAGLSYGDIRQMHVYNTASQSLPVFPDSNHILQNLHYDNSSPVLQYPFEGL